MTTLYSLKSDWTPEYVSNFRKKNDSLWCWKIENISAAIEEIRVETNFNRNTIEAIFFEWNKIEYDATCRIHSPFEIQQNRFSRFKATKCTKQQKKDGSEPFYSCHRRRIQLAQHKLFIDCSVQKRILCVQFLSFQIFSPPRKPFHSKKNLNKSLHQFHFFYYQNRLRSTFVQLLNCFII